VAAARTNFHALLVGDGPLRNELGALASGLDRIHFAGFRNQSDLPAFYATADALALTSDGDETWGLVVNEAMACGVPAIVSDAAGCVPDLIEEDRTGNAFPTGDVRALAQHLIEFRGADADALRRKCADYSMARATEGLERALKAVIHAHSNAR
jgi:glycosyltransferase involved in cell wall biosynthesis